MLGGVCSQGNCKAKKVLVPEKQKIDLPDLRDFPSVASGKKKKKKKQTLREKVSSSSTKQLHKHLTISQKTNHTNELSKKTHQHKKVLKKLIDDFACDL